MSLSSSLPFNLFMRSLLTTKSYAWRSWSSKHSWNLSSVCIGQVPFRLICLYCISKYSIIGTWYKRLNRASVGCTWLKLYRKKWCSCSWRPRGILISIILAIFRLLYFAKSNSSQPSHISNLFAASLHPASECPTNICLVALAAHSSNFRKGNRWMKTIGRDWYIVMFDGKFCEW